MAPWTHRPLAFLFPYKCSEPELQQARFEVRFLPPYPPPARTHLRTQDRMPPPKKVFIRTFGCQMNEYDSDKMADVLAAAEGYEKTDTPEEADLILFNTCSVREKAQEKVFADLG